MNEVYLTALMSIITGVGTWYAARRKNTAETQANELDNVEKAVRYYREMVEDLGSRLKNATNELLKTTQLHREAIDELAEARRQLHEANNQLNQSNEQLMQVKKEMKALEERFNSLAKENRALIDELKKYKQLNGKATS